MGSELEKLPQALQPEVIQGRLEGFILDQPATGLKLSEVLRKSALEKLRRSFEAVDAELPERLSIADLGEFDFIKKDAFRPQFGKELQNRGFIVDKHIADVEFLELSFPEISQVRDVEFTPFDIAEGAEKVKGAEAAATVAGRITALAEQPPDIVEGPTQQALDELERSSQQMIFEGTALARGDFSSPLARDFLTQFNELFTQPLATRGGAIARSGEAEFARSIGAQTAARQFGAGLIGQGLSLLPVADPLALPADVIGFIQQARQQGLFNQMLAWQRQDIAAAQRAAQGSPFQGVGSFLGSGLGAGLGGLIGGPFGAILGSQLGGQGGGIIEQGTRR